jgi:16S rRNA (cytidine1402-2'-O)-methyltransferase
MHEENGQDMPNASAPLSKSRLGSPLGGVLWIVATPIGNLGDLSPRAREALSTCEAVLCEDTRQGMKLMNAIGAPRSMSEFERLDAHASPGKVEKLIERLRAGARFALITDAGTPGVSDPGAVLVARAREAGIEVVPIPGPSAVLALLAASGLEAGSFTFRGFFPRKAGDQKREIRLVSTSGIDGVFVWFESPQRIQDALASLARYGGKAKVVAAKELTKLHEKFFAGTAAEVASAVAAELEAEGARGEWCFAVLFEREQDSSGESDGESNAEAGGGDSPSRSSGSEWRKALLCMLEAGVATSDAARRVAEAFEQPKKRVYEAALKLRENKSSEGG